MLKKPYGLIGKNLGHSISPMIHNMIFQKLNIAGDYRIFEVDNSELSKILKRLKDLKTVGVNVTIPYKIDIMAYLDEISLEAKNIQAVNTISFKGKSTKGFNTDYHGFNKTLKWMGVDVKNKKTVVLGTGGASRAVCQCLIDDGVSELALVSRSKHCMLFNGSKTITYSQLKSLKNWDIIINATPVGMYPNVTASPVDQQVMKNFNVAIDLIYNPKETQFINMAKELKLKYANGLYMLVSQAVSSHEIWQNSKIDEHVVEEIYHELK